MVVMLIAAATAQAGAGAGRDPAPREDGPTLTDEMRERMAAARADYEAAQERRETPEARSERERSRLAYRGLGRRDALELAMAKLGEVFAHRPFRRWELPPGARVDRYVGDAGAVVETADEKDRQLVESMGMPLTSELGSGEREPVDLSLVTSGDGFGLKNPVVATQIGGGGRVSFAKSGTAIGLAGSAAEEPIETNGRLFYANALPDV